MRIEGTVISGTGMAGERLNCPTANLHLDNPPTELVPGVFIGYASLPDDPVQHQAVVYYGVVPGKLEIHLLDWSGELYGKAIAVDIHDQVGDVVPWESETQMREKIRQDIAKARTTFKEVGE